MFIQFTWLLWCACRSLGGFVVSSVGSIYVTVGCPSVCPVDSSNLAIHICRRRQSAATSGQRQCCGRRRIDADLCRAATVHVVQQTVAVLNHHHHHHRHF